MEHDPREVFAAGARWWATLNRQAVHDGLGVEAQAERYFPGGRMDDPAGISGYPGGYQGSWPPTYIGRAFVEGAKWQEFAATGATMWQSDQREAENEALRRYPLDASL